MPSGMGSLSVISLPEKTLTANGGIKMMYVGLDVHKKYCHATVLDENGEVVKRGRFEYTREGFEELFKGIDDAKVAMESGYCWQPAYELLERMGFEVKLAHPLKTRLIADVKIKTDSRASESLGILLMMDLLPTSYVPPREIRDLRELTRLRTYLVRARTRFKNKVHACLVKEGIFEHKGIFAKKRKQSILELEIDEVNRCLSVIDVLNKHIRELSALIKQKAGESEEAKWLMSIHGVGYFSAIAILAEIGDITRFGDAEKLCGFAGLVPSTRESGSRSTHGRITKEGSPILRWVLEECVWAHLRYAEDTSLTRFFYRIAKRRGKQKAATATARKLLKVIYRMLKEKREFRAFHDKGSGAPRKNTAALAAIEETEVPLSEMTIMRRWPRIGECCVAPKTKAR